MTVLLKSLSNTILDTTIISLCRTSKVTATPSEKMGEWYVRELYIPNMEAVKDLQLPSTVKVMFSSI